MNSASAFTVATGKALDKRIRTAASMAVEFPKRYHKELTDSLRVYLRYGPPTWKLLYELAREAEEKASRMRQEELNNFIDTKRKTCGHEKTHYDADPSGNHDSTTTCCLCGKIL
jgi:ribosomal protein S27E